MNQLYTIVSGTHRKDSNTLKIARYYESVLQEKGQRYEFFTLEEWKSFERDAHFIELEKKYMVPASKLIFIVPEYNASIPGILKLMIDCSDYKGVWPNKKALITGVAIGRSGNIRGIDHLSNILQYLNVTVHPNKLPISLVHTLLDEHGMLKDPAVLAAIHAQLNSFIDF
jgi:chromate reductase